MQDIIALKSVLQMILNKKYYMQVILALAMKNSSIRDVCISIIGVRRIKITSLPIIM